MRQYSARQFDQAVNTLTIAAHEDPKNAEVHYNLGNALLQTGDAVKATREYELGYALSGSGPIAAYCSTALAGIRQRNHNSRTSTTYYRTTTNGVSRTAIRCPVGTESHRDGVEKSHGGLSAEEWSVWRVYYDKAFRRLEMKVILAMVPNWQSMTGISELYYYVDRNRKLRARVSRSTTDDAVNAALLEVVRNLDGSAAIEFPATIKADSFNFYHGVDLGEVALALRHQARSTSTTATMTNTNATLQQTGQAAAQGKLQIPPASTAVSATLQNSKVTADVAGKVIGRNSTELKAVQEILPPETASQSVKGQVLMEPAIPPEQKSGDQQSGKAAPEKSGDQQNGKAAPEKSGDQQSGDALPEKSGDQQRVKAAP
ncbi:MAG TPA: tetratricopeptide repeat protein [Drouetiella sp.]